MDYIFSMIPVLLVGLRLSIKIFFITIVFVFPLSIILSILKVSGPLVVRKILHLYTWIWRGTPLLLQLFFFYFALPSLGLALSPFWAAAVAYILNAAAYETEILRAGIESIDKGQYEATHVLGMSYPQTMRRVILPQITRRVLPTTCSEILILFKDTALVAAIGMGDLLRSAKEIVNTDFKVTAFFVAFCIYLVISSIIVQIFNRLEVKYSVYE